MNRLNGQGEGWWKTDHWFKLLGITVGIILIAEGAAVLGYLTPIIADIGGFLDAIIIPFGIQLVITGVFIVLFWMLEGHTLGGFDIFNHRLTKMLLLLAGTLLLIEAVGLSYYAGSFYSSTYVRDFWIAAAAGQLFVIGAMVIFGWLLLYPESVTTGWARSVAYFCSSVIAGEGLFVIGIAGDIYLDPHSMMAGETVSIIGVQLFLLGALPALFLGFRNRMVFGRRIFSHWLFSHLPLLFTEIVAIEGLILLWFSQPVEIEGIGGIRGFWSAAGGAQLFFLGSMASVSWLWRETEFWKTKPVTIMGLFTGIVLISEGLFILGVSAPIHVESIGGMLEGTMDMAGAQLVILGALLTVYWMMKDRKIFGRSISDNRLFSFISLLAGVIVALEGLITLAYTSNIELEGVGNIRFPWMALAGSQLFILGGISVLGWYWRDMDRSRASVTRIAGPVIAIIVMAEGLFIMAIAELTRIEGIGGVLGRTVAIAGAQLTLLGGAMIGTRIVKGKGIFAREVMGFQLSEIIAYLAGAIVALEGLVIVTLAADIYITGFGGISGRYIAIAGLQLFALAFLYLIFWVWHYRELPSRQKRLAIGGIMFLALMLPLALVL